MNLPSRRPRRIDTLSARMVAVANAMRDLKEHWYATAPVKAKIAGAKYGRVTTVDMAEIKSAAAFRDLIIAELNALFSQAAMASRCEISKRSVTELCRKGNKDKED